MVVTENLVTAICRNCETEKEDCFGGYCLECRTAFGKTKAIENSRQRKQEEREKNSEEKYYRIAVQELQNGKIKYSQQDIHTIAKRLSKEFMLRRKIFLACMDTLDESDISLTDEIGKDVHTLAGQFAKNMMDKYVPSKLLE